MRKRFDELSRSGRNKFIKRIKLSAEEKSSCTHNGIERTSRECMNKKNSSSNDTAIPSTSRENDGFEVISFSNDKDENQDEETMGQKDGEIVRQENEEMFSQETEEIVRQGDQDEETLGIEDEETAEGDDEHIDEILSEEDEETVEEDEDEFQETVEQEEEGEESDEYESRDEDEDRDGGENEEIIEYDIRNNNNINNNNNNNNNNRDNFDYDDESYGRPVYEGSPLTVAESMMVMMGLVLKHNLSDSCVDDIFEAISMHCLQQNLQKLNLYYYKKFFKQGNSTQKQYFCPTCGSSLKKQIDICPACEKEAKARYFVTLSITEQTRLILDRAENYNFIFQNHNDNENYQNILRDISDGLVYREHQQYFSDLGSLSYTWNTDGVPVFKSSQISVWPFYLRINELPYDKRIRRENTILAGLWFGNDKPIPHLFLGALEPEFKILFNGTNLYLMNINQEIFIRAILLCGTCDLPAKYTFLNFQQFNGNYGCSLCKIKTERTKLPSKKFLRVYRYNSILNHRTLDETFNFARQAVENKNNPKVPKRLHVVQGVKGPSILNKLMPNYVTGTGIDSMHALYEGVTKKLIYLWVDQSLSDCPFSLRPVMDVIDQKILKVRAPNFVHRQPRELSKYKSWKASELKSWCYQYSPVVLSTVMRPEYYNHYLLFVTAISLLNKDNVLSEEIDMAAGLLGKFVDYFEILYGVRFASINIHQLLHLPNDVRNFGPSWVNSCFSFEDMNGKIVNSVNGTTNIETQIMNGHWQYLKFHTKVQALPEGSVRNFILRHKKQFKICETFDGAQSIGVYKIYDPVNDPAVLDIMNGVNNNNNITARRYFRLLKGSLLYASTLYSRSLRTNSSFVKYQSAETFNFAKILYFIKISDCDCRSNRCLCDGAHFAIINCVEIKNNLKFTFEGDEFELPYLYECEVTNNISSIRIQNLISVCFCIHDENKLFLGCQINSHERE